MTTSTIQRVALTQAVEDQSEALVNLAETVFSSKALEQLRTVRNVSFMTQLNNLAGVARETSSPAVVENWIRYQMGRRDTARAWQDTGIGDAVLRGMAQVKELAETTAAEPKQRRPVEIAMIRRYAGYLVRWYVAKGGQQ